LGATLVVLNHLEDSPAIRRLQANVRVAAAQIEERGLDTADPCQVRTPEADQSVLDSDVKARVLSTRWLKKVLTPKIGTRKGLTCGPSLVTKSHSVGNSPQRIR
jgi:hypothetical protein